MEQSFLSKPTWHIAATTRDKNINCSISETLPTVQKCVWNVKYFYSKDKDKNDVNLLNDGTRNRPIWLLDKRAPLTNNADKITLTAVITFYADQRISNAGNTWTEKHGRKSTASSRHLKKKKKDQEGYKSQHPPTKAHDDDVQKGKKSRIFWKLTEEVKGKTTQECAWLILYTISFANTVFPAT